MIKLSKECETDKDIVVLDTRPKQICLERGTEPNVYLGKITPTNEDTYRWMSRWGFNCGEASSLEEAQIMIERCAKDMYE